MIRSNRGWFTVESLRAGAIEQSAFTTRWGSVIIELRAVGDDFAVIHKEAGRDGELRHSVREVFVNVDDARAQFKHWTKAARKPTFHPTI